MIMGPWNVNRGPGMWLWDSVKLLWDRGTLIEDHGMSLWDHIM